MAWYKASGSGGIQSDDVTATKAQVLAGYTALTSDSDDEVATGTMTNRGAVTQSLAINGTYTIPAGYHNGSGKVTQSISTKAAATYYTSTSNQTIAASQYLSGAQTIAAVSTSNIAAAYIKTGVVVKVGDSGNAGRIANVTGTFTSDATATAARIMSGYTAYVSGNKLTGTLAYYDWA